MIREKQQRYITYMILKTKKEKVEHTWLQVKLLKKKECSNNFLIFGFLIRFFAILCCIWTPSPFYFFTTLLWASVEFSGYDIKKIILTKCIAAVKMRDEKLKGKHSRNIIKDKLLTFFKLSSNYFQQYQN